MRGREGQVGACCPLPRAERPHQPHTLRGPRQSCPWLHSERMKSSDSGEQPSFVHLT